jgi:hypothetical protein
MYKVPNVKASGTYSNPYAPMGEEMDFISFSEK